MKIKPGKLAIGPCGEWLYVLRIFRGSDGMDAQCIGPDGLDDWCFGASDIRVPEVEEISRLISGDHRVED